MLGASRARRLATLAWFCGSASVAQARANSTAQGRAESPAPRLFSLRETTWIWSSRGAGRERIGYLGPGASVALRGAGTERGAGCKAGYYAVEPHGHVCADGGVTTVAGDPRLRALAPLQPLDSMLPFRYAISNGAPMYARLPTRAEQARAERWLGAAGSYEKYPWNRGHERLAEERRIEPDGPAPQALRYGDADGQRRRSDPVERVIPLGSMLAYTRAFEHEGRTFVLSADGTLVPADRLRPFRTSGFRGQLLDRNQALPLAWARPSAARWSALGAGEPRAAGEWLLRSPIFLDPSAAERLHGARKLWAARERAPGGELLLVESAEARRVDVVEHPPEGVGADGKWLHVSVGRGTLVAYRGARPVFATLISPGLGGVPRSGQDPVRASTTPLGVYRIQHKYRVQTMSPDKRRPRKDWKFWIAEVPYVQYFSVPFALHTAFWHEDFGEAVSGGCVNLSPADGRWLFDFTEPALPPGWTAIWEGRGSVVLVTR